MKEINKNIIMYIVSTFFIYFSIGLFTLVYNLHIDYLIQSNYFLSNFLLIGNISMAAGGIVFGKIMDKYSKIRVLQYATFLAAISFGAECFFVNTIILYCISFVYGLSFSVLMSIHTPFITEYVDEDNQASILNICSSVKLFASTAGVFVGGIIPEIAIFNTNSSSPYQLTLIIASITYFLAIIPLIMISKSSYRDYKICENNKKWNFSMVNIPSFFIIFLVLGLLIFLSPYMNLYLKNRFNMSTKVISIIITIIEVCPIITNLLLGKLFHLYSVKSIIFPCCMLCIISYGALAIFSQVQLQIILLIVTNVLNSFIFPQVTRLVLKKYPKEKMGQMSGLANMFYNIGDAIGTYSEGIFINHSIFNFPFILSGLFYVILLFFMRLMLKQDGK